MSIPVPFSCCKQKQNDAVGNKQCGYEGFVRYTF